ncbi:Uracil DNA glycosylase superfamily protein [Malonomonas rubra DSM 5091]|uniref:Uracil DNA glycosylase superfamily protein n=1 Tax=Malonomonas rubra DSM 5091 TaxID=1122189 RepID=A0A1M6NRS7_MALRU|nr:uracil-DNA glycosylase [Malonomonas rubra]SHJ98404.1 Uracil DNA glycosylase superfamily protein [Malonomonas rubra DSM 5091]
MPENFTAALSDYRAEAVFNPWGESDPQHDLDQQGAETRRRQLLHYLRERIGRAKTLLLAEAIGYQGGHFSGIPMTSERLLLGGLKHKSLGPELVFNDLEPQRTSRPDLRPNGFTEPTATIVWGFLVDQGIDPRSVVLWNAFPWHPYHLKKGLLSNRTPTDEELLSGHRMLHQMLELGKFEQVVAVGEKSFSQLQQLQIPATKVRHPANGGAGKFRLQMLDLLSRT